MSIGKNKLEANRWFRTAEDDLDTSVLLKKYNKFAHSCFHAQKAAGKAIKAIWYFEDADPYTGHTSKPTRTCHNILPLAILTSEPCPLEFLI
jgi:hypothetical protein